MRKLSSAQTEILKMMEYFMHQKESYHLPDGFCHIDQVYRLAAEHKILAIVHELIWREPIMTQEDHRALAAEWKRVSVREVMLQIQKTDGFLKAYHTMCGNGLKPLVVKGIVCRQMYPQSDYRTSSDEDILLGKKDFQQCDQILLQQGFRRDELDLKHLPYEIPYLNPQNGVYIELHFALFPEESGAYGHLNGEFTDAFESCIEESIQNTTVWTLNPTKHLLYLICHSLKHFLHSGFGIRQLCDMVMMAEYYGDKIDWSYIDRRLRALHMDVFWDGLAGIGRDYLGLSWEKACYPKEMQIRADKADYGDLLLDLMDSGIYGASSMERKHSSNMTLAAAESGKRDTAASLKASLFPGKDYMKRNYSWLERFPWLLPAAWVMRIGRYVITSDKKGDKEENGQNSVEIGMNRVELLRKYHIIK